MREASDSEKIENLREAFEDMTHQLWEVEGRLIEIENRFQSLEEKCHRHGVEGTSKSSNLKPKIGE